MVEYSLLAIMAAVVVLMLFLRTNTAICFLALCAGSVLLASSGVNVSLMASSLTSGMSSAANVAEIVLLLAPLAVCIIILRGQIGKTMLPMALLPALCTALLGAVFTVPLLAESAEATVKSTETWTLLMQYQEPVVGVGLVTSVVMMSMTVKKSHDKHKKHK